MRFLLALFLLLPTLAHAQSQRNPCYNTVNMPTTNCIGVGVANPLPVTIGAGTNFVSSQVTVAATATPVVAARNGRSAVTITNTGTTDVFCGPVGVTIANGDLIAGVKGTSKSYQTSGAIYCVVDTGTQLVSVTESY
jgi:hypothetical protein